ncbi:MAG: N-acetyltransferase [Planctomycetota bacterium]|nr:N-acetyltransferase [Planctomycetota bacterium]
MASPIEVSAVSSRSDRRRFLNLPWSIYRGDPNWVPPLRMNQKAMAGYARHPFYDVATAQTFLARRGGEVCGRISAIVNPNHNRRHHDQLGFFGFFESVDDAEVAAALFDAAKQWLVERKRTAMRGPVNPSMNYECGLLVDGFDSPPTFMMTYNPPYYARLLESCGLEKSQDLFSYREDIKFMDAIDPKLNRIMLAAQERFRVKVRKFDHKNYQREVQTLLGMFNRGTVGSWGFVPLTDDEAKHLGQELRFLLEPNLVQIARVDDEPVGVLIGLLDCNPIIKQIDGRLFPFGFLRLLRGRKRLTHCRFMSANVLPEYQRWGLGLILLGANKEYVLERGIQTGEFSWVLESNILSRMTLEKAGMRPKKTHRLYDCAIH